jgi:ribosomal protein L3 glutamine methyltransferase
MVAIDSGAHNAAGPRLLGEALRQVHLALQQQPLDFGHGTDNAWDEAVELVLAALDLPMDCDDSVLGRPLAETEWAGISALLARRLNERLPLPYLTGRAGFAGLQFRCDARALVPRSPLAELIFNDYAPWWQGPPPRRILDLCCGGGSIGIAAAHYCPVAEVWLADIDADALALASENTALHGMTDRVHLCRSDLFAALPAQRFDLILCNPPYVDAGDIATMPDEFRAEPLHALAAGSDGLDLALRILAGAPHWLEPQGLLFLEVGNSWEALDALCPNLALTWVEFEHGGHGVLAAGAAELAAWQPHFATLAHSRRAQRV